MCSFYGLPRQVGLFDTKRNIRVQKGRETQERERREREKSEVRCSCCLVPLFPCCLAVRYSCHVAFFPFYLSSCLLVAFLPCCLISPFALLIRCLFGLLFLPVALFSCCLVTLLPVIFSSCCIFALLSSSPFALLLCCLVGLLFLPVALFACYLVASLPCCLVALACASFLIFCSQVDLELDFLAPFLVKHGGVEAMTRKVALQVQAKLF